MKREAYEIAWLVQVAVGLAVIGAVIGAVVFTLWLFGWHTPPMERLIGYAMDLYNPTPNLLWLRKGFLLSVALGATVGAVIVPVIALRKK